MEYYNICVDSITVSSSIFINNDFSITANNSVSISHATFANKGVTISILADDNVSISSTTFTDSPSLISSNGQTHSVSVDIDSCTFNAFDDGSYEGGIKIKSTATLTTTNVSNSIFYNNQSRAVIQTFRFHILTAFTKLKCLKLLSHVTFFNMK